MQALPRGSTIGMLGGGQLARMAALAAAPLGYNVHVFTRAANDPCAQVTPQQTLAAWDDFDALRAFAASVDVITLEFENIPTATLDFLATLKPVHPGSHALAICQDRVREKDFVRATGADTTEYREITDLDSLTAARDELGAPAVLKTATMGYDGYGQARIDADTDLAEVFTRLGRARCIYERFVDFDHEVSLVLARDLDGHVATYPIVQNLHTDAHILHETLAPAPRIDAETSDVANAIGASLAHALDYVGVMAIEFFVTKAGALLVNEIAPRPHNSGHWTMDGAVCSQFEQQIRAVAGLPLGDTTLRCPVRMINLLGDEVDDLIASHSRDPAARLHDYGKKHKRPGRKMGHINILGATSPS